MHIISIISILTLFLPKTFLGVTTKKPQYGPQMLLPILISLNKCFSSRLEGKPCIRRRVLRDRWGGTHYIWHHWALVWRLQPFMVNQTQQRSALHKEKLFGHFFSLKSIESMDFPLIKSLETFVSHNIIDRLHKAFCILKVLSHVFVFPCRSQVQGAQLIFHNSCMDHRHSIAQHSTKFVLEIHCLSSTWGFVHRTELTGSA